MPPPRHRRPARPRWQFLLLVAVLAGVIVGVAVARSGNEGRSPRAVITSRTPARHGGHGRPTTPPPATATSTSTSPSPSLSPSSTPAPRGTLLIHGAGDTNVDPSYIPNLRQFGYSYALSGLRDLFLHDDLTVVNLECAVSNLGSAVPKEFNFRGDPRALPFLKAGGVEVANMGNNHSYDYGPEALVDTRRNIAKAGLAPVGAGKDPAEAEKPAIFHLKGWTIAVVGIDEVLDPEPEEQAEPGHPGTACGHDVDCMVREIRRAAAVSDLVVVDIHWGVELDTEPRPYQVEQARRFVAAGADVIFGGHSHRLQPLSFIRGKPVFWSLGNFVWPAFSVAGSTTAVAEVRVEPDGAIHARMIPAYIASSGHPVLRGA